MKVWRNWEVGLVDRIVLGLSWYYTWGPWGLSWRIPANSSCWAIGRIWEFAYNTERNGENIQATFWCSSWCCGNLFHQSRRCDNHSQFLQSWLVCFVCFLIYLSSLFEAIYAVYTSPSHPPIPNHLPTLIVTPHGYSFSFSKKCFTHSVEIGQPTNILYSYLHTNYVRLTSALLVVSLMFHRILKTTS